MKGCVQVRYLCNHEYTKLCKNGGTMNLPSPDLMPRQGVHLGTDLLKWKKKESSFLCCRNDKGSSSHMCPRARIVKTDLVLSPSHRCGWFF